jgi:hypothetical protein
VYVPASLLYTTSLHRNASILVMQDGPNNFDQVTFALDNISPPTLPPFVAISIQNGGSDAIKSERGLEYDTVSDRYSSFVEVEVLPAVLRELRLTLPYFGFHSEPTHRATLGCSSGAAAALTMAWFRPDLWGRVAAFSATLVDQQDHRSPSAAVYPLGAWDYHSGAQLITKSQAKPLRVFTHCSEFDLGFQTNHTAVNDSSGSGGDNAGGNCDADWKSAHPTCNWTDGHHNWKVAGNRTAAALKGKGYAYRHVFAKDAVHCDSRVINATLASTLVWLWG